MILNFLKVILNVNHLLFLIHKNLLVNTLQQLLVLLFHLNNYFHTKFYIEYCHIPLSFISLFSNLQELVIALFECYDCDDFDNFKDLQHVIFPKLQTFRIPNKCPDPIYVMKFLEINGINLQEFYTNNKDNKQFSKFIYS